MDAGVEAKETRSSTFNGGGVQNRTLLEDRDEVHRTDVPERDGGRTPEMGTFWRTGDGAHDLPENTSEILEEDEAGATSRLRSNEIVLIAAVARRREDETTRADIAGVAHTIEETAAAAAAGGGHPIEVDGATVRVVLRGVASTTARIPPTRTIQSVTVARARVMC